MKQDQHDDSQDCLRIPTAEEYQRLQELHPDTTMVPISEEQFENAKREVENLKRLEDKFPITKSSGSSLELFIAESDLKRARHEYIKKLEYTPIKDAISSWLGNLSSETKRNYAYYITDMIKRGIIPELDGSGNVFTVGHFNFTNHEEMIDYIKKIDDWSEGTRQVRAACYISFTAHLNRVSQGWFRKAEPSTLTSNKTFFNVRDKCATKALSLNDWNKFIAALYQINDRDALIAKTMLQGAKRISEVLSIRMNQVDFENRMIHFKQSKTGGTIREIPITYPETFMSELRDYIDRTKNERGENDLIFITNKGKGVFRTQLNATFEKASKLANLDKVTPHVLRATWVTLAKEQQVPDSEIMKVTGHTSSKMIYAYDKTSATDNYSRKLTLV